MNAPMDNMIPQAHKIESAIKSDHEQHNFDAIIPNVKDVGNFMSGYWFRYLWNRTEKYTGIINKVLRIFS